MKILWITNILFPEARSYLTNKGELVSSGGWMLGAAKALLNLPSVELTIACPSVLVHHLTYFEVDCTGYYVLPLGKGNLKKNDEYRSYWRRIYDELKPDVVHIHGTEFSHGLAYMDECGAQNSVISIQGLTSSCSYYYCYGLTRCQIIRNLTFRDLLRGTLFHEKREFRKRGLFELEMLQKASHIIGRTSWDRAHIWSINPKAKYYFCNETLRDEFYEGKWEYCKCHPHTIFISQGNYPIKGLHQIIRAMPLVLRYYPDAEIRVAGAIVSKTTTWKQRLMQTGYGRLLQSMIRDNSVRGHIVFLGSLNGEQMKTEYLRANLFICPSSIENSPNSLGEAQILGVPCIASYVGGTMDMISCKDCGELYRFEEIEMLAWKICESFSNSDHFDNTVMRTEAANRHNRQLNATTLFDIYQEILLTTQ